MSSRVRFLEPTRPFSIPNMPPKPPLFLVLKKNKEGCFRVQRENVSCINKMEQFLLWLAGFTDNHLLLFHLLLLTGVIVHRQQVTLHGAQLHALKHTKNNSLWLKNILIWLKPRFPSPVHSNMFNRIYRITLGLLVSIDGRTIPIPFTVIQIFGAATTHLPNPHFLLPRLLGLWGFTGSRIPEWKNHK